MPRDGLEGGQVNATRSNDASLALLCVLALAGCIIRPNALESHGASYDGSNRTSGNLGFYTNTSGESFMVITPHKRDRYEAMIEAGYGTNFTPRLKQPDGLTKFTNDTWLLDLEHQAKFTEMNIRRKESAK